MLILDFKIEFLQENLFLCVCLCVLLPYMWVFAQAGRRGSTGKLRAGVTGVYGLLM